MLASIWTNGSWGVSKRAHLRKIPFRQRLCQNLSCQVLKDRRPLRLILLHLLFLRTLILLRRDPLQQLSPPNAPHGQLMSPQPVRLGNKQMRFVRVEGGHRWDRPRAAFKDIQQLVGGGVGHFGGPPRLVALNSHDIRTERSVRRLQVLCV